MKTNVVIIELEQGIEKRIDDVLPFDSVHSAEKFCAEYNGANCSNESIMLAKIEEEGDNVDKVIMITVLAIFVAIAAGIVYWTRDIFLFGLVSLVAVCVAGAGAFYVLSKDDKGE